MTRFKLPDVLSLLSPLPGPLSAISPRAASVILLLISINLLVWAAIGIVLHYHPILVAPAVLSYTLGLRHALDADHISAIDLMTRRLIAGGQRPVTVGTFFSLGHSTIVVVTCIVVAATAGALEGRFGDFQRVGGIIGTSVSAFVLLLLSGGNAWVLYKIIRRLREVLADRRAAARGEVEEDEDDGGVEAAGNLKFEGEGFITRIFRGAFAIVDRPWKMFPVGILFGLGFDTSSEVALLGIASLQGAAGTSFWLILIFPILFTSGMCLLDTTDGALMMTLYTSKAFARDVVAILYYSIVLTGITVVVSFTIGVIQVLSLVQNVANPQGSFWDGVSAVGDNFDIIGGSICGVFLLVGVGSVLLYRPWRRRMDRDLARQHILSPETSAGEEAANGTADLGSGTSSPGV